ncbi:NADH-quinone oxidoreductase subunit L [Anaplasma marginale]|uniref:NADH-quinone oxidoreductase subunit L n=2 Tax=Anaplasma marginale TaxID=770 RepID=A0A643CJZ9_ANAMA|nr:NADH-quinone oxidoreductase subunit L [Anaplasma marginale]KAB0451091.1 NADH-quinone oxidoreductase subunit L [Anaplasma marginale]RCL19566.1 NADH-quinone oxidoreductase subunit L [Anaplasma marginale]
MSCGSCMFSVEFLCVTLPLIGAIIGQAMGRSRLLSAGVISSCVFCSAVLSWYLFLTLQQRYSVEVMPWFQIGEMAIVWSICIDKLSAIMLVVVTTVSLMVHLYSIGYMSNDSGGTRFLAYLSAFTFFMMVLVTSGNFVQLFFGWEGVGLCSYLLIGFWFKKDAANRSAMKAFVVNRVGDLFFLCGMLAIFYVFRSLSFDEIFEQISNGAGFGVVNVFGYQIQVVSIACILLFLGCMGKSAQLGLHTWLPDAMEGPTPASALIHAATMVTAGVFLIARCSPIFELSQAALDVVLVVGLATCLVAALVAIVQEDIKKIIAYSTCSQLGYMFVACGTANYHLAIFHLATHALFKSLLFLAAGNVIHSNAGEQRITHMSKNCWRDIPLTYALMWIGSLSLMGVFPFAGFYSKELIIESSSTSGVGFMVTNLVACLTSVYSCRLMLKVFHNSSAKRISSIHESSSIMLFPLLILAVGAVFSGVVLKSFWGITEGAFWDGSLRVHAHENSGLLLSLLPAVLGIAGALLYVAYHNRFCIIALPGKLVGPVHTVLKNKFYFDELYDLALVRPMDRIATTFRVVVDQKVIDYFLLGGITGAVSTCARYSVKMQSGRAFDYALVMLSGVVAATLLVVYGFVIR